MSAEQETKRAAPARGEWKSSAASRRKILRGARSAFARGGYYGTSMRQICDACGFRQPAIYHHFQNKEKLFRTILFESHERLLAAIERGLLADQSARTEIQSIFDAINAFHRREPAHLYLTFRLVFSAPPDIQRDFAATSGADYFRFLKEAARRHRLRDRRRRLGLLNDLLRSFLLGLAAPAMREGKAIDKRAAIAFILS
ncbi:MAG: TetR/AcrR family transcriptional regulator [bacterium]|nr:TetR/AcrR family transcriptional regulator [bacterium]